MGATTRVVGVAGVLALAGYFALNQAMPSGSTGRQSNDWNKQVTIRAVSVGYPDEGSKALDLPIVRWQITPPVSEENAQPTVGFTPLVGGRFSKNLGRFRVGTHILVWVTPDVRADQSKHAQGCSILIDGKKVAGPREKDGKAVFGPEFTAGNNTPSCESFVA